MPIRERKKRGRRRRREALVHSHLERASRDLLERYPDVVRSFIGKNAGIYALYKKRRLYYVGLASGLSSRLKHHVKDRHSQSWDRFSIYLTIKDQHLKEIESLLLQISKPAGNKVGGKTAGSLDLKRRIWRAIREEHDKEHTKLFDRVRRNSASKDLSKRTKASELMRFLPQGARLRGIHKGKLHKATARRDGRVLFNGAYYQSLSLAAAAAVKRSINGWWFWKVQQGQGNWVRLTKIRRAGTAVYSR
ncbi:MAG: GIY-YIG nuclease family protein [Bradyrhizobium sp.]